MATSGQKGKLVLLDGNSLLYRAYYALPPLGTADGRPTNAVYGFVSMLIKLIEEEKPDYIAVAWDMAGPTFRHEAYADYKAHRPGMPDDLRSQVPLAREVLEAMRIPVYEVEGYEADDVLGTVAGRAASEGHPVVIVTGDRDSLQLVDEGVRVMVTRRGISDIESYDLEAVRERYGVSPSQLVDVKALMGDPSDNIPGVPGVGEKTALKLIRQFGELEEVLRDPSRVGGKKLRERLELYADQARLSKELARIERSVPLDFDLAECRWTGPDADAVRELFRSLEFRSLIDRVPGLEATEPASDEVGGYELQTEVPPDLGERLAGEEPVGLAYLLSPADPMEARLVGLGLALAEGRALGAVEDPPSDEGGRQMAFDFEGDLLGRGESLKALAGGVLDRRPPLVGHDLKPLLVALERWGIEPPEVVFDTALAAYLLDPSRASYRLEDLAATHLGREVPSLREARDAGPQALVSCLATRAAACLRLQKVLKAELEAKGLLDLFNEVEMPLAGILAEMQVTGVAVDGEALDEMAGELEERLDSLTREIYSLAGQEFNINSTRQLAEVLFERLGLPARKRTKTGYSTDAEVLEELAAEHEIAAKVLEYRQLQKLKGTYVDGLKAAINPRTGRVHSSFNQTVTSTGRISSTEPNLQNIPIRLEVGRRIRKAFVPGSPDRVLLAADYSQIELRVLAHMSGDENLIRAFREGEDIHRSTAAEVFGVDPSEVTSEMRRRAKAVNFGIVYGISDFGLARDLGISRTEAGEYIRRYFSRYPDVKRYIDTVVAFARERGYVTTILNRRRYLPDIRHRVQARRQFAERTAMNTPIQGSAADIIKLAMIGVHRELRRAFPRARLILQVHDELVLEVPREDLRGVADLVARQMQEAYPLLVPLEVEVKWGEDWYNMRPLEEA